MRRNSSPQTRNRAAESEAQRLRGPPPRARGALRGATWRTVPQVARNRVSFVKSGHGSVTHPSVETERLLLRPWRPAEDLDALVALQRRPRAVMRWVTPNRPLTPAESAELLDRLVGHWDSTATGSGRSSRARTRRRVHRLRRARDPVLPARRAARGRGRLAAGAGWWGRGPGDRGRAREHRLTASSASACARSSRSSTSATRARCASPSGSGCVAARTGCTRDAPPPAGHAAGPRRAVRRSGAGAPDGLRRAGRGR